MKIAFAGSPASAVPVLRHLAHTQELMAVMTKTDAPIGRKRLMAPSPVAIAASEFEVPVIKTNRPGPLDMIPLLRLGVEVVVVVAYGALLSNEILNSGPRFLNVHFSLLPNLRGAAPVQAAILRGYTETGITIFEIDSGLDTGPILTQRRHPLKGNETTEQLLTDLTKLSLDAIAEVLAESPAPQPQTGDPSYAPKLKKSDGQILASDSMMTIDKKSRALSLEPGVFCETNIGTLRLWDTKLGRHQSACSENSHGLRFEKIEGNVGLCRGAKDLFLDVNRLQPAGKQSMSASDWWRGIRSEVVVE